MPHDGLEGTNVSPLDNPRHEQFAQLVAIGQSPAQAYAVAGYEGKTSYTCGPRLLRRAEVRARVTELQQTIAKAAVSKISITRETVLTELMDNALTAKQNHQWSASNRALELLGKELGMFVDHSVRMDWDGDLKTLSDDQLDKVIEYLEAIALQSMTPAGNCPGSQTIEIISHLTARPRMDRAWC